jgi:hypothetical protein
MVKGVVMKYLPLFLLLLVAGFCHGQQVLISETVNYNQSALTTGDSIVTVTGKLTSEGDRNYFELAVYDGKGVFRIERASLDTILISESWTFVRIKGQAKSGVFQVEEARLLPKLKKKSLKAVKCATSLIDTTRKTYDLNAYKFTKRAQSPAFKKYSGADLNQFPFVPAADLLFYDAKNELFAVDCGKVVLGEVPDHHGDYLNYIALVRKGKSKVMVFLVANTGFFLE